MRTLKRLYTSVAASIDKQLGELENHQAIIAEQLKQQQQNLGLAELRLEQVQQAYQKNQQAIDQQQDNIQAWNRRAQENANSNRPLALQCLHKREACEKDRQELEKSAREYRSAIAQNQQLLQQAQQQLDELSRQYELMRLQQCSAESLDQLHSNHDNIDSLHEDFERWQIKLSRYRPAKTAARAKAGESLEQQFIQQELQQRLDRELDSLARQASEESDPVGTTKVGEDHG